MSGRLDRLAPAHEAKLEALREEWRAVGLATGPADRRRAERGMRAAYLAAGLPPPQLFLWVRSPLEGVLGTMHLTVTSREGEADPVRDRLAATLRAAYLDLVGRPGGEPWGRAWAPRAPVSGDALADFLRQTMLDTRAVRERVARRLPARVGRAVRSAIGPGVAERVRRELQGEVRWQVVRRVWAPLVAEIQTRAWQRLEAHVGTHHAGKRAVARTWSVIRDLARLAPARDALHAPAGDYATPDWLATYDFFGRACGVRAVERLDGLMEVARAAGWCWWPHRSAVLLSDRPEALHLDERGRLHHARGPAVAYPDGWAIWAWHGVPVSRPVIENPDSLAVRDVLAEADVEVRRVMMERIGHERLLRDGGARRVSEDEAGILWRLDLEDDEPLVCVEVTDGTPGADATFRRYVLRVPPDVHSAREGVAWTFGMDYGDYRPTVET
ncbi:MAG TPA: hypothetical protein VGO86_12340 [Candidatus Dormibacteraeota bacterium]